MYGKSVLFSSRVVSICSVRCKSNSTKKLLEFLAEMPKANSARIAEAQRQRQHIAKKSEKYGPSTVYLQVLGSGARGAPNTLYLFTDQKRYLFNCGECTQRLAHEHKVKLSRLDHIFITSKTWKNIGGLPGLSLTLQDVGVPNITLHGPEGLDELYNATRRFVIMKDMNVTMANCSPSEDFEDNTMSVKYVLLGPHDDLLVGKDLKPAAKKPKLETNAEKEFEEFIHDETDYYKPEVRTDESKTSRNSKAKPKYSHDRDPMKKKTEKVLHDLQKKSNCSVAYICTLKKRLGSLDLAKCVEFGVKPGPLLGQLKAGHDVVLPDGTLVLSKDVKTPDDPGPVFIVLDVPEISYLKEAEFSSHFDNGSNPPENIPALIVHFTPPEVFHHPTYRSFMSMFGATTRHLILNVQNSCLGSEAVHRTQHKLHLLDPDIFPLLRDASVPAVWNTHPPVPKTNSPVRIKGLEELKNKFQNIINMEGSCKGDGGQRVNEGIDEEQSKLELLAGRTLTTFQLRPKKQLDRSLEPKLHIQDYIQETMDVDGFASSLEHFRRQVEGMRYAKTDSKEYPKVVFLGTGSCIPSKTRNTSAIVVHIDDNRSVLLDCAEGTFGQIVRFYGPKRASAFLRTLRAVYVSHLHADHHLGLIGVLQARRQAFAEVHSEKPPEPLYLLAPGQIYTWLSIYDQQFERIRGDFTLVPNQTLLEDGSSEMTSAVLASIGVHQIRTCLVSHCPNAFGVALQVDQHHKITYSGDTIPCEELVKIGQDSTLLIHEATMEDELADEARTKMHSTTSQAIDIGKQMNARYTLLTHFSQRYARLPRLSPHILNDNRSVGIAFDNMQITMGDLELLPHMYAPLQLMFAEHCVEMELKAAHRARRKERRASSPHLSADKFGRGSLESRKVSPGCVSSSSSSPPRAKYRESNASRLRQEIKGMTVTGIVRRPRSNSSSPNKGRTLPSTPKQNSESVTPKAAEIKACPVQVSTRLQNSNVSKSRGRPENSEGTLDPTTPRSVSETSDSSKEPQDSARPVHSNPSGYVVDTRSKTLNTASRQPTSEETMNKTKKSLTQPNLLHCTGPGSGYGKPLVTSLNKKLTVLKELPGSLCNVRDTKSTLSRGKSPCRLFRTDYKDSVSSLPGRKLMDAIKSRSSDKGATGRLASSNTVPKMKPVENFALIKNAVPLRQTKVRSSTYINREKKCSPTRSEKIDKHDLLKINNTPKCMKPQFLKEKSCRPDFDLFPNSHTSRTKAPKEINKSPSATPKSDKKEVAPGAKSPKCNSSCRTPSVERKKEKQLSEPLRQIINERLKQHNMETPISYIGRPNSGMYSRSFKPQLEDIKSSYMLLNKIQDHTNITNDKGLHIST
ncbi:unnamed protein product [Chilo suppressalis]|uniref:ribonuclease Z n=1 Tax=Chilo suppressalis TaxID=168631 RepID=A0ABN8L110_CHISP|nr:unnamed protein product [Chilo suppressalis]